MKQQVLKKRKVGKKTDVKTTEKGESVCLIDPIGGTQEEIRSAYRTYIEAQKSLYVAVKGQQQKGQNVFKGTEQNYLFYEEIIEKAFKTRERAEQLALEKYRNNLIKAAEAYRESVNQAILECKRTTDQAWNLSIEISKRKKIDWTYRCQEIIISVRRWLRSLIRFIQSQLGILWAKVKGVFNIVKESLKGYTQKVTPTKAE